MTACLGDDPDETLSETVAELSAFDWGGTYVVQNSWYGGQVATLNGTTYMVHTGQADADLYWRKRVGANTWSAPRAIPGQNTSQQVSLAAFNGYLYMVHVGANTDAVWFSRFDPATETWTPNVKLSLSSHTGAPALAAFDGKLWIVGAVEVADDSYQIWVSTMNTSEEFTPQMNVPRRLTSSRVSLAVYANKLYLAYSSAGVLYTLTHSLGGLPITWSAGSAVKAGLSGTTSQGYDPKIAVAGGYLHLVHRRPGEKTTWWTYWNQCKWAPEIQFDQGTATRFLALSDGGPGLVLLRDEHWIVSGHSSYWLKATEYNAPPAPITQPLCKPVVE